MVYLIFEKDRDVGCLGTIRNIDEEAKTFNFRIFHGIEKEEDCGLRPERISK